MLFLNAFLGADECTLPFTPTPIRTNDVVEISGAEVDSFYATKNVKEDVSYEIPESWDFDTVIYPQFNNSPEGGNTDWTVDSLSHLIVRRRKKGEYKWITLKVQEVHDVSDFMFNGTDITTENAEYEYAIFPSLNGAEGNYSSVFADVKNTHLVIADQDEIYKTILTDGGCETTAQTPSAPLVTLYDKFPTIVRNTDADYDEISVSAQFLPLEKEDTENGTCMSYDDAMEDDRSRIAFSDKFKSFLRNGKAKILKNIDGKTWLVYVTTPPSDTATNDYKDRTFAFTCTEIGSINSEQDLYDNGLSDIPEEWWYSR